MLLQDVTITLNLSEMSPEKYTEIMKMLEGISVENCETFTYSSTQIGEDYLTDEDKKLFDHFMVKG